MFAGISGSGIYRSNDKGLNWIEVNNGLSSKYVNSFTTLGNILFAGTNLGIFRSTNNGDTWTIVNKGMEGMLDKVVWALQTSGSNIYAGTSEGIFYSTDKGDSWYTVNKGYVYENNLIPAGKGFAINGNSLFSSNGGNKVYRTEITHLSASTNRSIIAPNTSEGIHIRYSSIPLGSFNEKIKVLSNSLSSPDTITVSGFGVSYGMTLNTKHINIGAVKTGQFKDTVITITNTGNDILVISNIASDNQAFAAQPLSLIIPPMASEKDTIKFTPYTAGTIIGHIIISSNAPSSPDTISLTGNGVLTDIEETTETPKEYALKQNFPNPFNPSTTIQYALPMATHVKLTVHDLLGRMVSTLVNDEQSAGWKEVRWDAGSLASGVYFYRLQAGTFTQVIKLLLTK